MIRILAMLLGCLLAASAGAADVNDVPAAWRALGFESVDVGRTATPEMAADAVPMDVIKGEWVDMASLTTGLFNDDPWPDLVFSGWRDATYIAFGNGDGSFGPAQLLDTAKVATVMAAYIDDDDKLDLLFHPNGSFQVLLGHGDGTFTKNTIATVPLFIDFPTFAIGYFNDDAYLDVAVRPQYLFFGHGDGHFTRAPDLPVGGIYGFATADFNLDGHDDLAVLGANNLALMINNGTGSFSVTDQLSTGALGLAVSTANAMADFNHDGYPDVATITPLLYNAPRCENNFFRSVVTVCLGDGAGHIAATDTFSVCGTSYYMVVTDVNRDGELDVAISNGSTRALDVFYGDGTGQFDFGFSRSFETGMVTFVVATDDLDRDGNPDFIGGGGLTPSGDTLVTLLNGSSDPVLSGKSMAVTAYGSELGLVTPGSYQISRLITTVGGGSHLRRDFDTDGTLDEAARDPVSVFGNYNVVINGMPNAAPGATFDAEVTLSDGTRAVLFKDYPSPSAPITFSYLLETHSAVSPPSGLKTNSTTPVFGWGDLVNAGTTPDMYEFQLDATYDFSSPSLLVDATGLTEPQYEVSTPLAVDHVYYWRVRWQTDGVWSDYSTAFAAYVTDMLCGDVDGDGGHNIADITFLAAYIFQDGAMPPNPAAADMVGGDGINVSDLTFIVTFLFGEGQPPDGCL